MNLPDSYFEGKGRILDLGGWFKPEPRATHVVDYLPWETRGATLNLERLPGERFTRETWFQVDFLKADLRLPFEDKSFDIVLCGQTVEDLAAPESLLREMQRVGRAGVVECPSRLTEQTIGVRDRMGKRPGHPHHHWIVESTGRDLLLYSKGDSLLSSTATLIPLNLTDTLRNQHPEAGTVSHFWSGDLNFSMMPPTACAERARDFVASLNISRSDRLRDGVLRFARRLRARLQGKGSEDNSWWSAIVEKSRTYGSI